VTAATVVPVPGAVGPQAGMVPVPGVTPGWGPGQVPPSFGVGVGAAVGAAVGAPVAAPGAGPEVGWLQAGGVPSTAPVPVFPGQPMPPQPGMAVPLQARTAVVPPATGPRRKKGLVVVLVALVLLVGAGGGGAFMYWDEITSTGPKKPGSMLPKAAEPQKQVQPGVTPPPPPRPWTSVQVTSTPMGAAVFHEGREIAKTPVKLRVPPDRLITYVLRYEGYRDQVLVLNPGETENKHVMLMKQGGESPKPKPVTPRPRPQPKPQPKPPEPQDPYEIIR